MDVHLLEASVMRSFLFPVFTSDSFDLVKLNGQSIIFSNVFI